MITHLTFPVLQHFLCQLDAKASCVHEVRLLVEIRRTIQTAYQLLEDVGVIELTDELESELGLLWEAYFIASDSFLEIANKWFELQTKS